MSFFKLPTSTPTWAEPLLETFAAKTVSGLIAAAGDLCTTTHSNEFNAFFTPVFFNAVLEALPGHDAVKRPRIDMQIAELAPDDSRDRTLARTRRAINGNDV